MVIVLILTFIGIFMLIDLLGKKTHNVAGQSRI